MLFFCQAQGARPREAHRGAARPGNRDGRSVAGLETALRRLVLSSAPDGVSSAPGGIAEGGPSSGPRVPRERGVKGHMAITGRVKSKYSIIRSVLFGVLGMADDLNFKHFRCLLF